MLKNGTIASMDRAFANLEFKNFEFHLKPVNDIRLIFIDCHGFERLHKKLNDQYNNEYGCDLTIPNDVLLYAPPVYHYKNRKKLISGINVWSRFNNQIIVEYKPIIFVLYSNELEDIIKEHYTDTIIIKPKYKQPVFKAINDICETLNIKSFKW